MTADPTMSLFAYGTLRYKDVQLTVFGRELAGREDWLVGYVRSIREVSEVLYFNIEPSADPENAVSGVLFEIAEQDLAAADKYEKARKYQRILVTLRSGIQAWAYRTS